MPVTNRLAGSGPGMPPVSADGPSPGLAGTLGAAPQAAPQNMLGAPQGAQQQAPAAQGAPQAPVQAPSKEAMLEAFQKESYVSRSLKDLLSKPDLSTKDVLDMVGDLVAEQVMTPFQAAQSLKDMPADPDPLSLRQWVGMHYARSMQALQTVSQMLGAHGAMTRGMAPSPAAQAPPMQPPPQPAQNALSAQAT